MQLSSDNIIQLYAPFAGIVVLAFWSGILTQKVADAVRRILLLEKHAAGDNTLIAQIATLIANLSHVSVNQEKMEREISGIHRALANIATGKGPAIHVFEQEPH